MNMNLPFWEILQCRRLSTADRSLLGLFFFFSFACFFLPLHTQATRATEPSLPSPPYSQLAFVAYLEGSWDLFVVSDNGTGLTGLRRLTNTPFDERNPSWSQDRNSIVYSTSDGYIHKFDLIAEKDVLLKTLKGVNVQPIFISDSDGQDVLYVHFSEEVPDDTDLYLLDIKTGKSRLFLGQRSQQFYPCWSPNGEHMAYINVLCSNPCDRMIQEIWVTDRFGKNARQLILTNSACETPAWFPDGRRLALSSDLSGNFDIYIYDIADRTLKPVTTDPHSDTSPAWSPDGSKLAFVSTRSGQSEIWIKDLVSDNLKRFVPFPGQEVSCKDVTW
jgi:TolB protein